MNTGIKQFLSIFILVLVVCSTAFADSTSNLSTRPGKTTIKKDITVPGIQTQQIEPVEAAKNWAHWNEKAWDAIKMAVNSIWIPQARIQNVRINGPTATCAFDCLQGPNLKRSIRSFMLPSDVPVEVVNIYADSIAGAWRDWQKSVRIQGLPWFPGFASYPGPQAPPTPSIPAPLISLQANKMNELILPDQLFRRIMDQLRKTDMSVDTDTRNEIQNFSLLLASRFHGWLGNARVQVQGHGPVPSFAPPYIPVGPVVGGDVIPSATVIIGNLN